MYEVTVSNILTFKIIMLLWLCVVPFLPSAGFFWWCSLAYVISLVFTWTFQKKRLPSGESPYNIRD